MNYDICIIGSGAGAGPIAFELAKNGKKVIILEKGSYYKRGDFSKDEIAYTRRSIVTPNLKDEYHVIEENLDGQWISTPTNISLWDFWNGNIVGGATNLMSGFFHRLKPFDLKLRSTFGDIDGANISDWPIEWEELLPFYKKVDKIIGVTTTTKEHPISKLFDKTATKMGINSYITPRAILSKNRGKRDGCYYSNYCGSYGCSSGAKGSSREALLNPAIDTGNLTILPNSFVYKLESDKYNIKKALYIDKITGLKKEIKADIFVVASQAVESCRLLLNSFNSFHPNGLGNSCNQLGKNLLFSGGGVVSGEFYGSNELPLDELLVEGLFVNRSLKDWYRIDKKRKGGVIEVLFEHANPIRKANINKYSDDGRLLWGDELYKKLKFKFYKSKRLNFEIFNDWLPNDNCFVSIDKKYKDVYGVPVAKIRVGSHPQNEIVGNYLAKKSYNFLLKMGAKEINVDISPYPPQNLQAGGCRFGNDPRSSVLDKNCRSWDIKNLFVTDGSFMPTGGSVPYTYTIYANSFRVAEYIKTFI